MKYYINELAQNAYNQYSKIIEDFLRESIFNYAEPKLKIKGEITEKSIGKKIKWRGVKCINCNVRGGKKLMFIVQRNIIISGFMILYFPKVFQTDIFHPFFGKTWSENFLNIKDYLGIK